MDSLFVLLVSAAIGVLPSVLKELLKLLMNNDVVGNLLRETALGRQMLKELGLERSVSGPEALFKELSAASQKMDDIVRQIQEYTHAREQAVSKLESQLGSLSQQEIETRKRVENLQNVPLPAAEYFAQLVDKGEKRSALRDYVLFLFGVLVSAGVGVLLKRLGWA